MADEPEAVAAEPDAVADEPEAAAAEPDAEPAEPLDAHAPNQGASGDRPLGESPLSVESDSDAFAEHPEVFVGAAFVGGLLLAQILRRFAQ